MPLELQPALLRAIEHGVITPVGSDKEIRADYRLIAATNRDLLGDVEKGRFREDLFYRLNVIAIELPPLRERPEDIPPLARHFLAGDQGETKRLSRAAIQVVTAHPWPGNVRELANAMEHARLLSQTDIILPEHLPPAVRAAGASPAGKDREEASSGIAPDVKTIEEGEIEMIRRALEQTGGNRTHAAELLGITRRGLDLQAQAVGFVATESEPVRFARTNGVRFRKLAARVAGAAEKIFLKNLSAPPIPTEGANRANRPQVQRIAEKVLCTQGGSCYVQCQRSEFGVVNVHDAVAREA